MEDEGLIARSLQLSLEELGYSVVGIVASSEEALELLRRAQADLILMDIRIHGEMDGIQLAQVIWAQWSIPTIYATAYGDSATLLRIEKSQPFGFILKPFRLAHIKAAIEFALYHYQGQRKLTERAEQFDHLFSQTFAATCDGIIGSNVCGHVLFINRAGEVLMGWTAKEAAGRPVYEVVRYCDASGACRCDTDLFLDIRRGFESPIGSITYVGKFGQRFSMYGKTAMVYDGSDFVGAVVALQDKSELKQMQAALEDSRVLLEHVRNDLEKLNYALRHDLPEPIRTIHLMCQLMQRGELLPGSTEAAGLLAAICEECGKITGLLESFRGPCYPEMRKACPAGAMSA